MKKSFLLIAFAAAVLPGLATAVTITVGARFTGSVSISGSLSKGSGTFVIDHPLDPKNKLLYHSFVESPDMLNLYDGIATLDANGEASITLPDYYDALNKDSRYQFLAIDEAMPNLYLKSEVKNNQFVIAGGKPGGKISWQVTGVRHDPYANLHRIVPEVFKGGSQPVKVGECLYEPLCL